MVGCGLFRPDRIDAADFPETYGALLCDRTRECALGDFQRDYHNMADCRATQDLSLRTLMVTYEDLGCDYTPGGAADAYASLAKMSCGAFYEQDYIDDMGEIWDGCDQDDTGI